MLLWSTAETAKQLSVSKRTVERLIEKGDLTAIRIGRLRRLDAAAVQAWVKQLNDQERTAKETLQERLATLERSSPTRTTPATSTNRKGKRPHTPIKPSGKGDAIAEVWKRIAGYNAAKREKAGK